MANCGGNCSSCSGCGRELVLTEGEVNFLRELAQVAFLPVARKMSDMEPVYLEEGEKRYRSGPADRSGFPSGVS